VLLKSFTKRKNNNWKNKKNIVILESIYEIRKKRMKLLYRDLGFQNYEYFFIFPIIFGSTFFKGC